MFASSSSKSKIEPMVSIDSSNENLTDIVNLTVTNIIEFTTSSTIHDEENVWHDIKSFFNPQNSMIILAIFCLIFFLVTLCLVFLVIQLMKKKRLYQNQTKPISNNLANNYPKLDHHLNFPSSPIQMGLTSNQIASLGHIIPTNKDLTIQESSPITVVHESNTTQSFNNFENELKRTWHEKGITSAGPSANNDDEVETVNEVLGMEERGGKVYYKVNFIGHPSDYTAWVCEEDLIPE